MSIGTDQIESTVPKAFSHYADLFGRPMRVDCCRFEDGSLGLLVYVSKAQPLPPDETYENIKVRFRPAAETLLF